MKMVEGDCNINVEVTCSRIKEGLNFSFISGGFVSLGAFLMTDGEEFIGGVIFFISCLLYLSSRYHSLKSFFVEE